MLVNITEAARLAGVSRTTLYAKLKNGTLSASVDRQDNRQVDTSELLRVFGELKGEQPATCTLDAQVDTILHPVSTPTGQAEHGLVATLREQIAMLKAQLVESKQREDRLLTLLETKLLTDHQPRRWWPWARKAA